MKSRRWLVVGAGGVGGYFGGLLAHGGHDVTFLARGDHLRAMRTKGLRVESVDGNYELERPNAVETMDGIEPFDVVLFCVKTYDNEAVARLISDAVDERSAVISVQNGVDNVAELAALLAEATVYPGLANIVSARTEPGVIRQSAGPRTVTFGDPMKPDNQLLVDIERDMRGVGIDATASPHIERDQWHKFAFIVAFGGMTALCRSPIGPILEDERAYLLYRQCVEEAVAVALAEGVDVDASTTATIMRQTDAYRGAQHGATSSMMRDVVDGRATEIESLNGAVVRRAKRHKIDAPINSLIHVAVRLAIR